MIVKIKGHEIKLAYSFRMFILYENITGESVNFEDMQSIRQLSTLFISCILASIQKAKLDIKVTYDDYMEYLDDNDGYGKLNEFAQWLLSEIENQTKLLAEEKEETKKSQD